MFKQHKQFLVMGLSLFLTAGVMAQGGPPDNIDSKKGKERAEAAQKRAEEQREHGEENARELEAKAREREEEARERGEEAREREEEVREREEQAGEDQGKRQGEDMPPGLKKKESAPQAGKGSETGQEKRQENSKAWWKFWD